MKYKNKSFYVSGITKESNFKTKNDSIKDVIIIKMEIADTDLENII